MVALVIFASALLLLIPGALFRERGRSVPLSLGLGFVALIVLFSNVAAIVGYRFWLTFGSNLAVLVGLGFLAARRGRDGRLAVGAEFGRVQAWKVLAWLALGMIFLAPAFVIPVPFDTDAQGFGYLALTVRESGSITTLAPFHPEVGYVYSPAYPVLVAYLSDLTGAPLHQAMLGFSHLTGLLVVVFAFALGQEIGGPRFGWLNAFATALTAGLFTSLMDSAYPTVLGLAITEVALATLFRAARTGQVFAVAAAGLALAALPLSHPDSTIHLLMAYLPFYATLWLARSPQSTISLRVASRTTGRNSHFAFRLLVLIPLIGLALTLPWLARELPLIPRIDVHERQSPQWYHWQAMIVLNGGLVPLLALPGAFRALRRRSLADVWMLTWIPPILILSSTPWLDTLSQATAADPLQILYPFGIAWHATIVPFAYFAAVAAEPLVEWAQTGGIGRCWARVRAAALGSVAAGGLAGVALAHPIIAVSKPYVQIIGALASEADLRAYAWIREHTPPDARLLNYPGRIEGQWAPVIAERDSVYIRDQLFYVGAEGMRAEQAALAAAYFDPASQAAMTAMRAAGIDYVVVPQVAARPDLFPTLMRWRAPWTQPQLSDFSTAPYLHLVADFDGAQVWRLTPED